MKLYLKRNTTVLFKCLNLLVIFKVKTISVDKVYLPHELVARQNVSAIIKNIYIFFIFKKSKPNFLCNHIIIYL